MTWLMTSGVLILIAADSVRSCRGTGNFTLFTNALVLEGYCNTGTCVNQPVNINTRPAKVTEWIILVVVGCFVAVVAMVLFAACYCSRRDKGMYLPC